MKRLSEELWVIFSSTPFNLDDVAFLRELNLDVFKISSSDITYLRLVKEVARCGKPIILSTGTASVGEVEEALAEWWQDFQAADDERRDDLMDQAKEEQLARQKAQQPVVKRVPRNATVVAQRAASPAGDAEVSEEGTEFATEGSAPKKRRRRRRKPGGGAGGGEGAAPAAAGE